MIAMVVIHVEERVGQSAAEVSDDVFPGRKNPDEGFGGDVSIEEGITDPTPNPSPTGAGWP